MMLSVFDFTEKELLQFYGSPQPAIVRRYPFVTLVKYTPAHRFLDWQLNRTTIEPKLLNNQLRVFLWALEKYCLDGEMFEEHSNVYPWDWVIYKPSQPKDILADDPPNRGISY